MVRSAMTKSTWNGLLAGGGLLATWLAVNPTTTTPPASNVSATTGASAVRDVTADDLNVQAEKLTEHLGSVAQRPTGRNPFRFGRSTPAKAPAAVAIAPIAAPVAPQPVQPSLSLSGIATEKGKHTAIITGDGQLYVVKEGDPVAGRYRVVTVDGDAVTLRDDAGAEMRLLLH
jgi:hypothetical protein